MRLHAVLAIALLAIPLAAETTTFDFPARFGPPVEQSFGITEAIALTLQYGPFGTVCVVRLAPPDVPSRDATMDSAQVDAVLRPWLEPLGPALSRTVTRSGTNSVEVAHYPSGTLARSVAGSQEGRTIAVTLDAEPGCSGVSRAVAETRYGPPQTDHFEAEPGLMIRVSYDAHHVVSRVEIRSATSPVRRQPIPTINADVADRLINDIVPLPFRTGTPERGVVVMSRSQTEHLTWPHLTISHQRFNSDLVSVVALWR